MKNSPGFIALLTIFLISFVALTIALKMIRLSGGEVQMRFSRFQSSQAGFLADLCAEEALLRLKENLEYPGGERIEIEGGFCQILAREGNIIKTEGYFQNYLKRVRIEILSFTPKIKIRSWKEVADF